MKKSLMVLALVSSSVFAVQPEIKIQGIFDGPISGQPTLIEFYVQSAGDLEECGFGIASNANPSDGEEYTFAADDVMAGDSFYVTGNQANFTSYFGFAADYENGAVTMNGDDTVELYCGGALVDVYGSAGTDGTGQPWEYLDGWAYRNAGAQPNTTWMAADWTLSGINVLDGCATETNATCGSTFPIGTLPVELQSFSVE